MLSASLIAKTGLKADIDDKSEWRQFFRLVSALFAREEKKPVYETFKDYNDEKFVSSFNKNNKKGAQIVDGDKGDYKIVIKAEKLDFGSGAASVVWGFGAGGSKIWGTLTVIDQNSGNTICTLEIDEVDGGSSYTEVGRRCDTAEHLSELLAKLIKKSK